MGQIDRGATRSLWCVSDAHTWRKAERSHDVALVAIEVCSQNQEELAEIDAASHVPEFQVSPVLADE